MCMKQFAERCELIGMILFFICIGFGQIIWLFDPWTIGTSNWIDSIEWIWYVMSLPFLLWFCASTWRLKIMCRERTASDVLGTYFVLLAIRILLVACALFTIWMIVFHRNQLILYGVSAGLSWSFVLLDQIIRTNQSSKKLHPYLGLTRQSKKAWILVGVTIMIAFLMLFPTSYRVTTPGMSINMNHYAKVASGQSNSKIMGVLVLERPAFAIDWLYAKWFKHYTFVKRSKLDTPMNEQLQVVRSMKLNANKIASAVAFQKTGISQGYISRGVIITQVMSGTPADGIIYPADHILSLNNQPINTTTQFKTFMKSVAPGDIVHISIIRNQNKMTLHVNTRSSSSDSKQAIIGVQISDDVELELPLTVSYKTYWIHQGGPSHGAMLTLALIDQLTAGGVTYGYHIAGTGTIDLQGRIGPVGGIEQKAYTVSRTGADVFFVPSGQEKEAIKGSADLHIVPVKTIDEVLAWLRSHPVEDLN
jgi:PDZ domain-containing protein